MLEAVWSWAKQWGPAGQQDAWGLSSSRGLCCLSVGAGSTCSNPSWGSLAHSIDEGCVQETHGPQNCTGYLETHQQGSLIETSSCSYMGAHIWLQEEWKGEPFGSVFFNTRNSKIFASGEISHPLDVGPFSSGMSLLPDRGRREMFPVSWAGWGLTAHWCLS